jgi:hypothetical protein
MKLDFGKVLSQSWGITWRHKTIWILILSPIMLSFLFLPFIIGPLFFLDEQTSGANKTVILTVMLSVMIVFGVINILVNAVFLSSATLGVVRADRGEGSLSFIDLLRDGAAYFGRILGVMLIISLTIGLLFTLFFLCVIVSSLVTMGLAAICLQPFMVLLTPVMFLMVAVMEGAETAVIAQGLGAMDAVKQSFRVVRAHVWEVVIMTLIIYFGTSILSSLVMMPLFAPIFAVPFLMETDAGISQQAKVVIVIVFLSIFFPVMIAIQSLMGAFLKVSLDLTYLRLAQPKEHTPEKGYLSTDLDGADVVKS